MSSPREIYTLGIYCYFNDSSACLLKNGELVAMAEEERFTRVKHCHFFPEQSIRFCLKEARIEFSDISRIAYGFKPFKLLMHQAWLFFRNFPRSLNLIRHSSSAMPLKDKLFALATLKYKLKEKFGPLLCPLIFVDHHVAHAYSTYFVSPFTEAAILIADGFGEVDATSFYHGNKDEITHLSSIAYPQSLGVYYGGMTQYLGFKPMYDEYKVMGMCAYGKDSYHDFFAKVLSTDGRLKYNLDESYFSLVTHGDRQWFSDKMEEELGSRRQIGDAYEQKHFDIACSAQRNLELVMRRIGQDLQKKTQSENLCLAGGIAQNILMNRVLLDDCGFKNIFVPPVAYDGGVSLGAALAVHREHCKGERKFSLVDSAWGPGFSDQECMDALNQYEIPYSVLNDRAMMSQQVAVILSQGKIVGYFSGRMEIGPRALGHRSILADPSNPSMKDILNSRIKKREFFRPFAAMVPLEDCKTYFDLTIESAFMTICGRVKMPQLVSAVTHADGMCRVQTVNKDINPAMHSLLKHFEMLTNVPVLINTSLNENEPIVCTPHEALECFLRTKMDCLVFNHRVLVQKAEAK